MNGYGHLRTSTGMGELQIKDAALAVPPCQGGCREFESRLPLQFFKLILSSLAMTANP